MFLLNTGCRGWLGSLCTSGMFLSRSLSSVAAQVNGASGCTRLSGTRRPLGRTTVNGFYGRQTSLYRRTQARTDGYAAERALTAKQTGQTGFTTLLLFLRGWMHILTNQRISCFCLHEDGEIHQSEHNLRTDLKPTHPHRCFHSYFLIIPFLVEVWACGNYDWLTSHWHSY